MEIILPPEIEALALQAAKAGGYPDVAAFVAAVVRKSASQAEEAATIESTPGYKLPYPEWRKRFQVLLDQAEPGNPKLDDSRESIYAERASQLNP